MKPETDSLEVKMGLDAQADADRPGRPLQPARRHPYRFDSAPLSRSPHSTPSLDMATTAPSSPSPHPTAELDDTLCLDSTMYPHILDAIIDASDGKTLRQLRLVSRSLRVRVEARLGTSHLNWYNNALRVCIRDGEQEI